MTDRRSLPLPVDCRTAAGADPAVHSRALARSLARAHAGKAAPWLIALLVALAGGGAWWGYAHFAGGAANGSGDSAQSGERPPGGRGPGGGGGRQGGPGGPGGGRFGGGGRVQPVSVGVVRQQDIRVTLQAIGSIAAANTAVIKAKVEGELKSIHFREGQFVAAGALLAELDNRAFVIALAQSEGQLARDQAQLQNARLDVVRFRDLLAKDGIARQQVDTQEALVRQLQGTVQSDQAQVDNARLQLSHTRIVAPIAGRVGLTQVDLGNVVKPGDSAGLVTIAQTSPVNVVFSVPDNQLPQISRQLKAGKTLEVEAWDRDQKQRLAIGRVASTDNAIDAATGTIKLKASFANADGALFPNQFVNVRLQLGTLAGALAVPAAAVLRNAEGSFVYLVGDDNKVSARPVRAGAAEADWVSVQGELNVADRVVVDGTDRIRNGATVEVIVPPLSGPASAQFGNGRRGAAPDGVASGASVQRLAGVDKPARTGSPAAAQPVAAAAPSAGGGRVADASAPARPDGARGPGGGGGGGGGGGEDRRAAFLASLPPDVAEKVKAMSPEERRAWFQKRRAERSGN